MENLRCDLLVIGGGPGGYAAAFRAADLGLKVVIAEQRSTLGGVCLNVGCIPSKTYLHQAALIREVGRSVEAGIQFGAPQIDLAALRAHKDAIVGKLVGGLAGLAKSRKVRVLNGRAHFTGSKSAAIGQGEKAIQIVFRHGIVAVGSEPTRLPMLPDDPRILDSSSALELAAVSGSLLVIGGGIIGLEMATIYSALGMKVDIVELTEHLMPGADRDLVAVWEKINAPNLGEVMLQTRVVSVTAEFEGILVCFEGATGDTKTHRYDYVLSAVGREPNGAGIAVEAAGIRVDDRGFLPVDTQMRTNVSHIFAVGDVVGAPMLAHKAAHQGHVAAEVAAGEQLGDVHLARSAFDALVIPAVAYTDPEIAWVGITEDGADATSGDVKIVKFPWAASGRALANGCEYGFTKLLFDRKSETLIGGAIVGPGAGDMIGEIALAVEMGAEEADIALTIHPHPTLGETIGLAAEIAAGNCTDLPAAKRLAGPANSKSIGAAGLVASSG